MKTYSSKEKEYYFVRRIPGFARSAFLKEQLEGGNEDFRIVRLLLAKCSAEFWFLFSAEANNFGRVIGLTPGGIIWVGQ